MIRDEILGLIENHTYNEGETIPSDDEIAETYGVSGPTAHRAIDLLVEAGYLERHPRKGTIVRTPRISQRYGTILQSFDDEMHQHNLVPRTQVISSHKTHASAEVASSLRIKEGALVYEIVRLRYANDAPNVLVNSFVPLDLYPHIDDVDFAHESLYAYFAGQGNPVLRARRTLIVVKADSYFSALLDVPAGDPLERFSTIAYTSSGRIGEYSVAYYRGDINAFEFNTDVVSDGGEPGDIEADK